MAKICNEADAVNDPITDIVREIYSSYWNLVSNCELKLFPNIKYRHPLPLGLMSAHVFANYYLQRVDNVVKSKYAPLYYGRYVDDCMLVLETKSESHELIKSINEEIPDFFIQNKDSLKFNLKDHNLRNLVIQRDKLFLYRFNAEIPQIGIEKYTTEQFERSSEFRFLTEEEEHVPFGLEHTTLSSSLELDSKNGKRFATVDDNKFKISVYLAKLASRVAKYPTDSNNQKEIEKVYNYFKGQKLIKHYRHWEKILSIFVLGNQKAKAFAKEKEICEEISKISVCKDITSNPNVSLEILHSTLNRYLYEAKTMAFSLHIEKDDVDTTFINTFFSRQHYNIYPLQEFSKAYTLQGVRTPLSKCKPLKSKLANKWIPYYVHYYDIICALTIGFYPKNGTDDLYIKAYSLYCQLNNIQFPYGYYAFYNDNKSQLAREFNPDLCIDEPNHTKISVALVELKGLATTENMIKKYGIIDSVKAKRLQRVLDNISEINDVDIFVLPEMAIPIYSLKDCCKYSAGREKAFVAGMEYCVDKSNKMVYNYTITCLPITLFGMRDAIPVIRLKNHYAPIEIEEINKFKYRIPKEKNDQYLYHWKGHVFTTYYCYELTNIRERSHFFGCVDAMYIPVWNKDTYYYNNIAESMARDMHCYFILSNVSQYGDSRVTYPAKNFLMNQLKVKGGNTEANPVVVLTDQIDIKSLREFQLKNLGNQSNDANFKHTAPNFPKDMARGRSKHFLFPKTRTPDCDVNMNIDDILRQIAKNVMSYRLF